MSPPEKRARVSHAQELSTEEKNEQFQRGVLNMMQLHPQDGRNILAERVFERMPLEGFVDMKKVLLPENRLGYDGLLSFGCCEVILNKFEKKEPLLRVLREEYESLTETRPRLSGVCEIASRLWNVKYNEKMKSKIRVNIHYDEPLLTMSGTKFDFSTDFLVTTKRLYDESDVDENEEETKSFNGQKLTPLNVHLEPNPDAFYTAARSLYLFVYYLHREDPEIVKPKHIRTIELADIEYHHFAQEKIMYFRVCGNFLAVAKKWWREIGFMRAKVSYGVEFYDMKKSRKGEPDLIYKIDKLSALGWCNDPIARTHIDYDLENSDSDSDSSKIFDYRDGRDYCFFSENIFVCSRNNGDGNFSVEIHEISSDRCAMIKKVGLHTEHRRPLDNLYNESLGNSTWNFFITSQNFRETHILLFDKKDNELTTRIEEKPLADYFDVPQDAGYYFDDTALDKAIERVVSKLKAEGNVFGHVRFSEEREPGTDKWMAYYKFYA